MAKNKSRYKVLLEVLDMLEQKPAVDKEELEKRRRKRPVTDDDDPDVLLDEQLDEGDWPEGTMPVPLSGAVN